VSKILIFDIPYRIVVKAPEYASVEEIENRLNCSIGLDMPNARLLDIEAKKATVEVIDGWEKEAGV
jgi:hypothetical protein